VSPVALYRFILDLTEPAYDQIVLNDIPAGRFNQCHDLVPWIEVHRTSDKLDLVPLPNCRCFAQDFLPDLS
jgi:hypothetical protein